MEHRLPKPGTWYDDPAEFSTLEPGAKPRRPVEQKLAAAAAGEGRRQRVRARPSAEALAPWDGRFYWCAFCNYVNTEDEKGAARCPRHRQEWERMRKAAQRAGHSSASGGDQGELSEYRAAIERLASVAAQVDTAVEAAEQDLAAPNDGQPSDGGRNAETLVGLTRQLLDAVSEVLQHQRLT